MLTVEELKALKIGDWVYIVNKEYGFSTYERKPISANDRYFITCRECKRWGYSYSDYGKKWIAYKNKEQAELEEYND